MSSTKKNQGIRLLLKKNRIFAFALIFVCALAFVGTAAEVTQKKVVAEKSRLIELTGTPVRIELKGNQTYRISLDGKTFSREYTCQNQIRLRDRAFDPMINPPQDDMAEIMSTPTAGNMRLYIVQCLTQAIEPYQQQITVLGGEICGTFPDNALLVAMPDDLRGTVGNLPFVRWVGPFHASYKLSPDLRAGNLEGLGQTMATSKVRYHIWLVKKNKSNNVADFITNIGGEVIVKTKGRRIEANLDQTQLNQVASLPWVLAIDRWTPPETDMNLARELSGANYLESIQGYTGQGVRAEVMDGGMLATHVDFQANKPIFHPSNSSDNSHGTSVYGIVFGSGAGDATARGLLPNAEQPIFSAYGSVTDRYAHTAQLVNPSGIYRAVFQTNSWGDARTTSYTTISADMDDLLFDHDILILQSQSNAGTRDSRPQAWAKNILSIGAVNHYNTLSRTDDCWCSGASIGPASDGRIKPELAHFYDATRTSYYSSNTAYADFGGTSGATPITAGYTGLFFQMWADGVFSGGPGMNRDVFNSRPHAATAKAILIHSAYQYPFSGTNDDKTRVHQGWGMIDVQNLYQMAQNNNWGFPILIDESAVITPLQVHSYTLNVTGTQPLKATMVYCDPAGVPGAAVQRINDLSLRVTSPSGTIYWGNNGLSTGVWSTSGGTSNKVDTVENVFIQSPQAGAWTIEVLADEVVQDAHVETPAIDADYALIVTGGTAGTPVPPPAAPTNLAATAGENSVILDWADNTETNLSGYRVKRALASGGPYSQIATVTASNYTDTGLNAGTVYYYVVTAVNTANSESTNSNQASATPYVNPPAAPTSLSATTTACTQVNLTWSDNTNNETSYKIERSTNGTSFTEIASVSANTTAYSDTTVSGSTAYWYRVRAYNAAGYSNYSNTANLTTPVCVPPNAPSSLRATAAKNSVALSWTDNATNETGFRIYRGTTSSNLTLIATVAANVKTYSNTGLPRMTTYYYKVCAYNNNGESCSSTIQTRTK